MLRRQEHPLQKRDLLVFLVDNGGSYSKGSGSAPRGPRRSSLKFNIEPRLSEGHGGGRQSASMFGVPTSATKRQDQSIVRNTLNCCSVLYVRAVYIGTPESILKVLHRHYIATAFRFLRRASLLVLNGPLGYQRHPLTLYLPMASKPVQAL